MTPTKLSGNGAEMSCGFITGTRTEATTTRRHPALPLPRRWKRRRNVAEESASKRIRRQKNRTGALADAPVPATKMV